MNENNKFNLIYNICVVFQNPILYYNISNLKTYLYKFNGKKIININYDDLNFAENLVKEQFSEYQDIQFVFTKNTSELHEVEPFIDKLLPSIYSLDDNEYTYYGNAKGVSRYRHEYESVSLLWTYTLHKENLQDFNKIVEILQKYSCCGCFKINIPYTALGFVPWHFSGTHFWFKNKSLFSKSTWRTIYGNRYGVEGYPATHFNTNESYCIKYPLENGMENIYNLNNWEKFYRG